MAGDQKKGKFPENIRDMQSMENLGSPDELDTDSGQGSKIPPDQGDNIAQAGTVPTVSSDALFDTPADEDDDGRIDISSGEDVDVEPDEEEQSDEPAPPIIPPDRIE